MEEEIYLTPNLYVRDNITYYMDDTKNKEIRVNKNNWHKYLEEYGWMKLDKGWIRRLNQYSEQKNKNSCYGVLDCGGDGDCLFYCIAEAIKEPDMNVIRSMAAKEITDENFDMIIESYRVAYDINDFDCQWDPHEIKTKEQLQDELKKSGHNYWGDYIVIQLLEKALDCNFIILNSEKEEVKRGTLKERFNIHSLGDEYDPRRKSILLYYIDGVHFELVGYFDGGCMKTVFEEIPLELFKIYREDCRGK
jgi:hypothetical protein